ncbi:hypothetical protein [Longimicrobium terrae]|uniref:Uncharacterized protein n=1 Tax=Longimicrobium terrae TaxID=1639882 RepID=A0A841H7Z6_9BACT|nr:hypothetical protein [Longimicrobium terrae]MBB4637883.1 hypothetical protein [Longimicrobium terrae]MBB6074022.1 hypothetical protein [Longimicrobium terrae]NNC31183.1 hypothetical protein [Longimicrobium terrae]
MTQPHRPASHEHIHEAGAGDRLPAGSAFPLHRLQRSARCIARLEEFRVAHQERVIRREARLTAGEMEDQDRRTEAEQAEAAREGLIIDSWVVDEAEFMLRDGWTEAQLLDSGFTSEVLDRALQRIAAG